MHKEQVDHRKWMRTLTLALGILLGTFILNEGRAQQLDNSLLWEISGNGIKKSYVYGTFHLLPQEDFELKKKVTKAFDVTEQVVMELDMDDPGMQMAMMQHMQMVDGTTLDQLISEEDMMILDEQLKATANLTAVQVNTFKPFMVETLLLPSFIEGTPASYEMSFLQRALDGGQEIKGLEEVADQTALFDEIPYQDQADDLVDVLKNRTDMQDMFSKMIDLYKEENINQLYLESKAYFSENELQLLLHQRNADWIPSMAKLAKDKPTFFAVGAGHLGGNEGVINLLRKEGYKVKAVNK